MSIDEAIAQLEFNDKKGAKIMKEVWSCMFTLLTGCYRVFVCAQSQSEDESNSCWIKAFLVSLLMLQMLELCSHIILTSSFMSLKFMNKCLPVCFRSFLKLRRWQ